MGIVEFDRRRRTMIYGLAEREKTRNCGGGASRRKEKRIGERERKRNRKLPVPST